MVAAASTMVTLGSQAPRFSLPNPRTGGEDGFESAAGPRGTLVMFICNHCPYVVLIRERLLEIAAEALRKGVGVIAINANDAEKYPQDGPEPMRELAESENWPFPFVFDSTQEVAHAYQAACTPDFFLFDADATLYYRGQFDDARPHGDAAVTGADLGAAIASLVEGKAAPIPQVPSLGCAIKWIPGNAP